MRLFTIIVILIIGSPSFGQSFSFPVLNDSGKTIKNFIPNNWFLKDSVSGDLNGDGISDLAMVIEYKDTIEEIRPDSVVNKGSPRILLVLFKNKISNFLHLVIQNNTFILRYGEGGMDPEPYGRLIVSKKILSIEYDFLRGSETYKFRYQHDDFYLIGMSSYGATGAGTFDGLEVNFLTMKIKETSGDVSSDHEKVKWRSFSLPHLMKLKDYKTRGIIDILPDISI